MLTSINLFDLFIRSIAYLTSDVIMGISNGASKPAEKDMMVKVILNLLAG